MLDEAELFNVAVLPAYQGRGLAKELLKQMESLVEQTDGRRIYLEVRVSNLQAQALYLRMGYTVIGRRKILQSSRRGCVDYGKESRRTKIK